MCPSYTCVFTLLLTSTSLLCGAEFPCSYSDASCDPVGSQADFSPERRSPFTSRGQGSQIPSPFSVRIADPRQPTSRDASVSVYQLTHKVPKEARKEYEKAGRAKNNAETIEHLEKAIAIDPDYLEALNNLGSRYIQTDHYDKAMEVLTHAQKLDGSNSKVQTNLAVALLSMNQIADAERAARRANQLSSAEPQTRYVLGLTLMNKHEFTDETVGLLRTSSRYFPNASVALAVVYAGQGKNSEARNVLKGYLAAGHRERESQVRQMLSVLKQ